MNTAELLEERAERGAPRGAASVWAEAQHEWRDASSKEPRGSAFLLRAALLLAAVGLLAMLTTQRGLFEDTATQRVVTPAEDDEDVSNLPAPILIDGMRLDAAMEPWTAEQRASRLIGGSPVVVSTRVYADPDDPFGGPVVGIDTVEGGGFSPWAANVSTTELLELTSNVSRDGPDWTLPERAGLIEVAQLQDDPMGMVTDGWQLDFADGGDTATIQFELDESGWVWIARVLRGGSAEEQPTMIPVEVLGHQGALVSDEVLWEADGYSYRLTAGELRGNTHYQRAAGSIVDQLRLVDRAEWNAAVEMAGQRSPWDTIAAGATFVVAIVALLGAALSVWRRPRRLALIAGIGVVAFALWYATAPNTWFTLTVVVAMLAALVLLIRRWSAGPERPPPPPSPATD